MKKIVIATRNKGKLKEYEQMLEPRGFEVFSMFDFDIDDVEETGETFLKNAILKAQNLRKVTSEIILADDSGLEVFTLDNKPGVHSRRLSEAKTDEANNLHLLEMLAQEHDRRARFVTVIVLLDKHGHYESFEGELHGYIHTALEGKGGFGYDPIFIPVGQTQTLAALGDSFKNTISHRSRCLKQAIEYLENL